MVSVQSTVSASPLSRPRGSAAVLFLNATRVGAVQVRSGNSTWGYGHFTPEPEFSSFAPIYGRWSLLMHAQGESEKPDRAIVDELARAERLVDSVKAQLFFASSEEWVNVGELAIANEVLEWREY